MDKRTVNLIVPRILKNLERFLSPSTVPREAESKIREWMLEAEEPDLPASNWFTYEFQPNHIFTTVKLRAWNDEVIDLTGEDW